MKGIRSRGDQDDGIGKAQQNDAISVDEQLGSAKEKKILAPKLTEEITVMSSRETIKIYWKSLKKDLHYGLR